MFLTSWLHSVHRSVPLVRAWISIIMSVLNCCLLQWLWNSVTTQISLQCFVQWRKGWRSNVDCCMCYALQRKREPSQENATEPAWPLPTLCAIPGNCTYNSFSFARPEPGCLPFLSVRMGIGGFWLFLEGSSRAILTKKQISTPHSIENGPFAVPAGASFDLKTFEIDKLERGSALLFDSSADL